MLAAGGMTTNERDVATREREREIGRHYRDTQKSGFIRNM